MGVSGRLLLHQAPTVILVCLFLTVACNSQKRFAKYSNLNVEISPAKK